MDVCKGSHCLFLSDGTLMGWVRQSGIYIKNIYVSQPRKHVKKVTNGNKVPFQILHLL